MDPSEFRPMTQDELVEYGLAPSPTQQEPSLFDLPIKDGSINLNEPQREWGYQGAKGILQGLINAGTGIASINELLPMGGNRLAENIAEWLTPLKARPSEVSPLREGLLSALQETFPKEPTTEAGQLSKALSAPVTEAAALIPLGGTAGAMPFLQLAGGATRGLSNYSGLSPETGLGAETLVNLLGGVPSAAKGLSSAIFGVGKEALAAPIAQEIIDAAPRALLGPAELKQKALEIAPRLGEYHAPAVQEAANLIGDSATRGRGALIQAMLREEANQLGKASRLAKTDEALKETLSPEASTIIRDFLGIKPSFIPPSTEFGIERMYGNIKPKLKPLEVGEAYNLVGKQASKMKEGVSKTGEIGETVDRLKHGIEKLASDPAFAAIQKIKDTSKAYKALRGNKAWGPFIRVVDTFKQVGSELGPKLVRSGEAAQSFVNAANKTKDAGLMKDLGKMSYLSSTANSNPETWAKNLAKYADSGDTLLTEQTRKSLQTALEKGDKSVVGFLAKHGLYGPNIPYSVLGSLIVGVGGGFLTMGPIGSLIGAAGMAASLKGLSLAKKRPMEAMALVIDSMRKDPENLKLLALEATPTNLARAKKIISNIVATGIRSGIKIPEIMGETEQENVETNVPSTSKTSEFRPMTEEELEEYGLKKKPMSNPSTPKVAATVSQIIDTYAPGDGVPKELAHAVLRRESAGNADAVSPKGAMGYMQLMPGTFKDMSEELELNNPDIKNPVHNIRSGIRYLRRMHDKYNDWRLALAAYNWGPKNMDDAIERYGTSDWDVLKTKPGVPSETKQYLAHLSSKVNLV